MNDVFVNERDGKSFMIPVDKFGVKVLSIGMLVDPDKAIPWRGPMASKALRQLFSDADWGELDYMLIDLPPEQAIYILHLLVQFR
jgi:ATP-binding protein involved in chromosome partitioning